MLRWLIYWLDPLIMMLWLEILGGHVHLSLQDLAGGQFWENKPSLGFHGATSPQVGCQGPACWMRENILGRPWWCLIWHSPTLTCQTIFPWGEKRPLFEHDIMCWGLGHGGEMICFGTWMFWGVWGLDLEGRYLDAWHVVLASLDTLLLHQQISPNAKTPPKGVTPF